MQQKKEHLELARPGALSHIDKKAHKAITGRI